MAAGTSTTTPDRLGYRPALDGVRGIAIALVVCLHAFERPLGGFLGVDLFFVLSGFLITTLLLEERQRNGRVSFRGFYRRRALRLVPALIVMLTAYTAVAIAAAASRGELDWRHLRTMTWAVLGGFAYVSDFLQASGATVPFGLSHLWSLAIEEQFYLLWPVLLLVVLGARRRLALVVLSSFVAAVAAHRLQLVLGGTPHARINFAPDTRFDSIFVGCFFGVLFSRGAVQWASQRVRAALITASLATVLVLVALGGALGHALPLGFFTLFAVACGLAICEIASSPDGGLAHALSIRPLVFLGRISYSLYLWHVPVLMACGALTAGGLPRSTSLELFGVAASVGVAYASYYLVELPFLRRKRQSSPLAQSAPAATAASVPAPG